MTIVRAKRKKHNFSIIDNTGLIDTDLTWKETGLLAFLMTKPDGWNISIKHLSSSKKDGRESVSSALRGLQEKGYVYRLDTRSKDGRFQTEYIVFETKEELSEWMNSEEGQQMISNQKAQDGKTGSAKPDRQNRIGKTVTVDPTRKTRVGSTVTENPHLVNIDIDITDSVITEKEITPESFSLEESEQKEQNTSPPLMSETETLHEAEDPNLGSKEAARSFDNLEQSNNAYIEPSVEKCDRTLKSGGELPPWMIKPGPNGWCPAFVKDYKNYLSTTPHYVEQKRSATDGEARNSLNTMARLHPEKLPNVWNTINELKAISALPSQTVSASALETSSESPQESPLIGYFADRGMAFHESIFSEFLDDCRSRGTEGAVTRWRNLYDPRFPGATDRWLAWIEETRPDMYKHFTKLEATS